MLRVGASRFQSSLRRVSSAVTAARPVAVAVAGRWDDEPANNDTIKLPLQAHAHLEAPPPIVWQQQRSFWSSSSSSSSAGALPNNNDPSSEAGTPSSPVVDVDDTLDKLFQDQELADATASAATPGDAWYSSAAESATAVVWDPTWYNLADQAVVAVKGFHELSGMEYGWCIVGITAMLRLTLFPLMVQSQRATSRMAHLQPELTAMKQRYESGGPKSRQDQVQFGEKMKNLFAKYQVKPMRAFAAPLVQLPLFMGMFFGLKKMPGIYPGELATGGMLWFPDLTVPDPLYILPLASATTFLLLIEMGKDQMMVSNPAQGQLFVNVFRVMAVTMIPVCVNFEAAMLCYWTANNVLTLGQTAILKNKAVRKRFGIWDPPKPVPGTEPESLKDTAGKLMKSLKGEATSEKQKIQQHNKGVETKKKAKAFQMMRSRDSSSKRGITGKRST